MQMAQRALLATLLAAGAMLLAACDGSSPTAILDGPALWAGNWQGTTGQGKSISFSVGGTAGAPLVTRYEVTVRLDEIQQGDGPLFCLGSESTVSADPASAPIVGGAFAIEIPGLESTILFEGRFDSAASASGQLTIQSRPGATCMGRGVTGWTAQRS